jgi:hypothetical protein
MKEVVFDNGKLVLQKRKISQVDELFLIGRHLKSVQWEWEYKHVNSEYMCM